MSKTLSAFVISPVRGISEEQTERYACQVAHLEAQGIKVYWPLRDTRQRAAEIDIARQNRAAMQAADVVYVIYDGKSEGCLFDLGMAFAMGKKVVAITGYVPRMTRKKSFANLIFEMEEEM